MDDLLDWLGYHLTRPLCWLNIHTRGCRGKQDHHPHVGRWL